MKVISLEKFKEFKDFPPIKIPEDGTKIGIEQLKNIVDISFKLVLQTENIISLRDKNILTKIFKGYVKLALFLLDTSLDIYVSIPVIASEFKDLDYSEINELVLYLAERYELNEQTAQAIFDKLKKVLIWLEDGVITFSELKEF